MIHVLFKTCEWAGIAELMVTRGVHRLKIKSPLKRLVVTLLCYGCNIGSTELSRSLKGYSQKQIAWLKMHAFTENRPQQATSRVIRVYQRYELPKLWGSGRSVSVDVTQWNVYEQNILSEYHIRYGGTGGIGYYHVSDQYIARFSQFIPCGVHESLYLIDGVLNHLCTYQVEQVHGDTHAQSYIIFGLYYRLGIRLLLRIKGSCPVCIIACRYKGRSSVSGCIIFSTRSWQVIRRDLPKMLQLVPTIGTGTVGGTAW